MKNYFELIFDYCKLVVSSLIGLVSACTDFAIITSLRVALGIGSHPIRGLGEQVAQRMP